MSTGDAIRERIRELIRERGLTEYGLILKAGMPPSTVKSVMNSKARNPRVCTITMICAGLNITLREFYDSELFDNSDLEEEDHTGNK